MIVLKYILAFLIIGVIIRWFYSTKRTFKNELRRMLETLEIKKEIIREEDLSELPELLKTYLRKTKVVGSQRVTYFHAMMHGEMKLDENKSFAPVKAQQYTFIGSGTRLFHITMNYKGLPISGLHHYNKSDASMLIKILDLFQVVHTKGCEMQRIETVTYFNDLCILAPGGLVDEAITWQVIDDRTLKGTLEKHGHKVTANLYFNEDGMLENFISKDRVDVNSEEFQNNVSWSTPMSSFSDIGDYHLANQGAALWHYPKGDHEYIRIKIRKVTVNSH